MAVGNQDEIRRDRFPVDGFRQRIAGDKRVEEQRLVPDQAEKHECP